MSGGNGEAVTRPAAFELTPENLAQVEKIIAKYPDGRRQSAVLPVLALCQRQRQGWLPQAAIAYVARLLDMPAIRVHEVATFYTMFELKPVGRRLVQVCTTTPCWLMGSDEVVRACEQGLGLELGQTSDDGAFTLREVECLGACVNGPVMQVDQDYYEDLDAAKTKAVLEAIKRGETPPPGPQGERHGSRSCPAGGPTTLTDLTFSKGE
jgi:NADH-quinone oxidoreductase subunit E